MSDKDTGGWAFPCPHGTGADNGMTLRDYFAAAALKGFAVDSTMHWTAPAGVAQLAYEWADAMLEARKAT